MSKSISEIRKSIRDYYDSQLPYIMVHHSDFDYTLLQKIPYKKKGGKGRNNSYNDCIIMFDTETSKERPNDTIEKIKTDKRTKKKYVTTKYVPVQNYVVAWTMSIFALDRPLVTLWGHTPDSLIDVMQLVVDNMRGDETFLYAHNMPYDYTFCRKYMYRQWGTPTKQLNVKPHYPINITFEKKGKTITVKDSLVLSQRKLEKWAEDLGVEHQKAVGCWDYDKIRTQWEKYTKKELKYMEHDTLAGVECIYKTMTALNKSIYSLPYTATGIPREETQKLAKQNHYKSRFEKMALDYEQYKIVTQVFHGGYTHANRHFIGTEVCHLFGSNVVCYDFASSYPYCMLSQKFPMEKFTPLGDKDSEFILRNMNDYAFYFRLIINEPKLKDDFVAMPCLQKSKCVVDINSIVDNGRILKAEQVQIYVTEQDLSVIMEQYKNKGIICTEIQCAKKDYLPRWFTDYAYSLYVDKCKLKNSPDQVLYNLQKAKLNSLYGMLVQKSIREQIIEDYKTGEYKIDDNYNEKDEYEKYLNKKTALLPYQWGVWVTAYAFKHLFELGKCCEHWIYSDTDSCYGINWNKKKLDAYNKKCKEQLIANGYGAVEYDGQEFWLGVAEFDGEYSEFITLGAKRYCCRYAPVKGNKEKNWNKLKITVAGVPKVGVDCLNDDIHNFKRGFVFDGDTTKKLMHSYIFNDDIQYVNGISYGDCVDLNPCDYLLDDIEVIDWDDIETEIVEVQVYD